VCDIPEDECGDQGDECGDQGGVQGDTNCDEESCERCGDEVSAIMDEDRDDDLWMKIGTTIEKIDLGKGP
jgi:hypothetical protein